jgi:DNA-binding HxlR family transcriptional regulator
LEQEGTFVAVANKVVPEHVSCDHDRKALVAVLDRVGSKWTIMIVAALSKGPLRYGELHRGIGNISQRMLTLTLKGLTEDGLVSRTVYPTIPPRVDYELTELGFGLRASLIPLRDWASENIGAIATFRTMNRDRSA